MLDKIITKTIGMFYEIIYNQKDFSVSVIKRDKVIAKYTFDKLYKAVNFYARLKKIKDVKNSESLAVQYQ